MQVDGTCALWLFWSKRIACEWIKHMLIYAFSMLDASPRQVNADRFKEKVQLPMLGAHFVTETKYFELEKASFVIFY